MTIEVKDIKSGILTELLMFKQKYADLFLFYKTSNTGSIYENKFKKIPVWHET